MTLGWYIWREKSRGWGCREFMTKDEFEIYKEKYLPSSVRIADRTFELGL
jgi:hypothetical protein